MGSVKTKVIAVNMGNLNHLKIIQKMPDQNTEKARN